MSRVDSLGCHMGLPGPFIERLEQLLPESCRASCLDSFSIVRPTSFRVNPLKCSAGELARELRQAGLTPQPVQWLPGAFTVEHQQRRALTDSPAFHEGRLYIQGLASMLAPLVLDPRPGEKVLDMAAAPGGKTLQIAAMMENRGTLSAVESVKGRFFRLRANLSRHGATMVKSYLMDGRAVGSKVPGRFDRVLLDAPCSSEARFRAGEPATWSHWSLKKIRESARKQARLLESGVRSLKPGGRLVYATCSFAPEENEQVIDRVLRRHPGRLTLDLFDLPIENLQPGLESWKGREFDARVGRSLRVLPDSRMSGFFLCRLTKTAAPG